MPLNSSSHIYGLNNVQTFRIGMKPLFYFNDEKDLLISSEIKPILNQLSSKKKFSLRKNYINFFTGIIDKGSSQNQTLFKKIYSSRPGEIVEKKKD